jgi:WD40 repeat protein
MTSPASVSERLAAQLGDRYRIERELGKGGMATVYLAHDLRHDRKVALKVLRPELAALIGAERFLHEIKTTANLQHPHILPLHDSGQADGTVFYVMPYVEGESLRDQLTREKQLPIDDAIRIACEVADALGYAHEHGIIHRDIKPENILLQRGHSQVADFGIALAASPIGGARMTETGMSLGTPQYMSPEQAMGERNLNARSDVYALGCVLYEMLTGEPPFTGPTAQAIVAKVMSDDPRPPSQLRRAVPPNVEAAVLTALEKVPADRFASAAEFAKALGSPTFTRTNISRPFAAAVARRPLLRDPRTWITLAAVATAAVLLVMRVISGRASEAAGPTVATILQPANEIWRLSGSTIALSPDGRKLATLDYKADEKGVLVIRSMDSLGTVHLRGTEGARYPFWSPDGSALGFFADGQLKQFDLTSAGIRTLCAAPSPNGGSWGTNGDILYAPERRRGLHVVPAGGGKCRALNLKGTGEPVSDRPFFLADGRHFIVSSDRGVWVGSLDEDVVTKLVDTYEAEAVFAPPDYLLTKPQGGGLYAQRIDVARRRMIGTPEPLLDQVRNPGGRTAVSASASGTLVAAGPGDDQRQFLVFATRGSGAVDSLPVLQSAWTFRFSHDGRRLALAGWGLWMLDMERRVFSRAAVELDTGRIVVDYPAWAPGDTLVAFSRSYRDPGSTLFNPRSQHASRWFDNPNPDRSTRLNDWSPDGKHLLLELGPGSGAPYSEIWLRDVQAKTVRPLVSERGNVGDARFSPDKRWIAYRSDADGENQVYLRPFPGPGQTVRVSPNGGSVPRWRGDGRELFYSASGGVVMAVGVSPAGGLGTPAPAVSGIPLAQVFQAFEPTPDGQRFAVIRSSGVKPELTLVLNWWKLLDRKR